jgi:hypothetical protein
MSACEILRAALQLNYVYEGEPPQVLEYCRRRPPFPWWEFEQVVLFQVPGPPVELKGETVFVSIDMTELMAKVRSAMETKTDILLLDLDGVEAEQQPGTAWAVYAGPRREGQPNINDPSYVGTLAVFGSGVRSEKHHEFKPAHFVYPLNRALQTALMLGEKRLQIAFVPLGIVVDGKPSRPEVKSPVQIGKIRVVIEKATEAK